MRKTVTLSNLKECCRKKEMTVTALAEEIGCARPVIYFALERPGRYSRVYKAIQRKLLS